MAYLEDVLYPKMQSVFSALPCAQKVRYGEQNEFFPDVLASDAEITSMCSNNYFIMYENAFTWRSSGESVCDTWQASATSCAR
jgi:hypothetical protein